MNHLLQVIGTLLVVGLLLWGIRALPIIDGVIKQIITVVIVVAAGLWLIHLFFPTSFGL